VRRKRWHFSRSRKNSKFLGGGTNLIDLMREHIEQPDALIDVTKLTEEGIRELPDGGVAIGAAVKNSAVVWH
jgi:xanthine dehydrogenase YagS FAD-binding subunit